LADYNEQLKSANKQLDDENKLLNTTAKQLNDENKQLKTIAKQLDDENKQLKTTVKQLDNEIKQLKTTNKQLDDDNKQLKTINKQLDDDNKQLNTTAKQLDDQKKQLKATNKQLDDENKQLKTTMNVDITSHEHVAPVIFKMNNFTEKMKNKQAWYSNPFFAFWRGYKMCLKIWANGIGYGEGTHVSVFLYCMNSPYDDELEQSGHWPLRGMFKVELLNQLNDKYTIFRAFDCDDKSDCINRVIKGNKVPAGFVGDISHTHILHNNYLKPNDSLYFMISYQSFNASQVAPVNFTMNNFTEKMTNKDSWYSDPFFAFWKGYKMGLKVYAGGNGVGIGTHVSVFLYLMKGPYDDLLEQSGHWPLKGTFKIELLNHLNHENQIHYIRFDGGSSKHADRVKGRGRGTSGYGEPQFISHKTILDSDYLKYDSLFFTISYQENY